MQVEQMKTYRFAYGSGTVEFPLEEKNIIGELHGNVVEQIFDIIRQLHADGTTILLVEQNAQAALAVADRGYVLETGRIVTEGAGAELLESDAIRKAYLGG